ncbi:DsbA family oxidoreductase [Rhodobacter ferrooxidans]|uniref:DSBA oxidoreductase n=1 Tax=Rhodobacter ferrooxidans TaxID=371731 RepID=C8RZ41_9RHOB|nr:DsbA family oxidoreductase [Rhodobacter sp. SW2]EEW25998.1 DSBA oxidoreductase [Rhodobacter sp. SW2]
MIRLDIFSDPVCPWCYIGKALLDRALEAHPTHPFAVAWHPFQLNPGMPKEGVDRAEYLEAKFGGKLAAVQVYARVEAAAAEAGLVIDFAAMKRMPNTLDAHRLIHWAGLEGKQSAAVSALFRGFFREGLDIGDAATLARIAGSVGMDEGLTARLLASDADRDDLIARDIDARKKGVNAVPTYLIAGQHVLSGAQPTELWGRIIDDLAAQA